MYTCSGVYDILVGGKKVGSYDNTGSFGELALMYNMPRAATIIATTEGTLWAMVCTVHISCMQLTYRINFVAGVSLVGENVTFCSARYNFKICDFISGVVNVTRDIQQYCRKTVKSCIIIGL